MAHLPMRDKLCSGWATQGGGLFQCRGLQAPVVDLRWRGFGVPNGSVAVQGQTVVMVFAEAIHVVWHPPGKDDRSNPPKSLATSSAPEGPRSRRISPFEQDFKGEL